MKPDLERNPLLVLQPQRRPDLVECPRARHTHLWRYTSLHQLEHERSLGIVCLPVDRVPQWQRFVFVPKWSLNFDSLFYLEAHNQPGQLLPCRSTCTRMISWVSRLSSSAKVEQILDHVIDIGICSPGSLIVIVGVLTGIGKL